MTQNTQLDKFETFTMLNSPQVEETDDEERLIQPPARERSGWINGAWNKAKQLFSTSKAAVKYVFSHKALISVSILTALPNAVNAFIYPNKKDAEISWELLRNMSPLLLLRSWTNFFATLLVDGMMGARMIPKAIREIPSKLKRVSHSPKDFFDNLISLLLASGGAIAAAAVGYTAFNWLPDADITGIFPALLSLGITLANRYVGATGMLRRFFNLTDKDVKTRHAVSNALKHLNMNYQADIQQLFTESMRELGFVPNSESPIENARTFIHDHYQELIAAFNQKLFSDEFLRNHPHLVKDTSKAEYAIQFAQVSFDLAVALMMSITPFIMFTQNGFDGIEIIYKLINKKDLRHLSSTAKMSMGFIPGLSGMFYFQHAGLNASTILKDLAMHLYNNPTKIPIAMFYLFLTQLASNGQNNILADVIHNPDNIFHLREEDHFASVLTPLGSVTNFLLMMLVTVPQVLPKTQLLTPENAVNEMADYLSQTQQHVIRPDIAESLRSSFNRHSLFMSNAGIEEIPNITEVITEQDLRSNTL